MPNNNNDFFNDLPNLNKEANNTPPMPQSPELPSMVNTQNTPPQEKPLIEIPQAYYDKLAAEQAEAAAKEAETIRKQEEAAEASNTASKNIFLTTLCAIITFVCLYCAINITEIAILVIPIYIILGTIISVVKAKKETSFPVTVLIGGMIVAVVTFILSMLQEDQMDMWTYYAVAGAVVAFVGLITGNIITKFIVDRKNIKAIQCLGYLLYFVALVAVPAFLYTNYREEFYKFVFQKQTVVEAETEEEFVMKTIKNRYGVEFVCDETKTKHEHTVEKRKAVKRTCKDSYGNTATIYSIAYNEGSNEYIVIDDYINVAILNNSRKTIGTDLINQIGASEMKIYYYPKENCTFVGDCVDNDDYFENYQKENDINNQFKVSTELNLQKYLKLNYKDFVNQYEFKIVFNIVGKYSEQTDYNGIVNNILNKLNQQGYKNNYGYIITINNDISSNGFELAEVVYQVTGDTNPEKTFKDPQVVDLTK